MQEHLGDPELSPGAVAEAHRISVRSLHRLFQGQGCTVTAWIRAQRPAHVRRDLADPALTSRTIQSLADRWGFPRPADFTRTFRAAYGVSPQEYRNAALPGRLRAGPAPAPCRVPVLPREGAAAARDRPDGPPYATRTPRRQTSATSGTPGR